MYPNPFHLLQRHIFLAPVVELGGGTRGVGGDVLGLLEAPTVFPKCRDACGSKRVASIDGRETYGFGPAAHHLEPGLAGESVRKELVRGSVDTAKDAVRFSDHAQRRMDERLFDYGLDVLDVFRVLRKGKREEEKDEWDGDHREWSYAFRGKTLDGTELRVSVALKANGVLVVIVVNLERF